MLIFLTTLWLGALYGAPIWQKVITFITPTLIFVWHQSIFRATQNFFNQYNIYLYTARIIFCQHVFLFCATLDIFSLSFGCHVTLFVATTYIFVTHNFGEQHDFYVKYFFFCWHKTVFCATRNIFCATCTECEHSKHRE